MNNEKTTTTKSSEPKQQIAPRKWPPTLADYRAFNDALAEKLKSEPAWKPARRAR